MKTLLTTATTNYYYYCSFALNHAAVHLAREPRLLWRGGGGDSIWAPSPPKPLLVASFRTTGMFVREKLARLLALSSATLCVLLLDCYCKFNEVAAIYDSYPLYSSPFPSQVCVYCCMLFVVRVRVRAC